MVPSSKTQPQTSHLLNELTAIDQPLESSSHPPPDELTNLIVIERIDLGNGIAIHPLTRLRPEDAEWLWRVSMFVAPPRVGEWIEMAS